MILGTLTMETFPFLFLFSNVVFSCDLFIQQQPNISRWKTFFHLFLTGNSHPMILGECNNTVLPLYLGQ
jgi:hypothetical protein